MADIAYVSATFGCSRILLRHDRPVAQIPPCITSHHAPFCSRNVRTYVLHTLLHTVTQWCIVGYLFDAVWGVCDRSIAVLVCAVHPKKKVHC